MESGDEGKKKPSSGNEIDLPIDKAKRKSDINLDSKEYNKEQLTVSSDNLSRRKSSTGQVPNEID